MDASENTFDSLDAARRELIALQRSALLGAISGMIAHEFNNLMTPVLARAQDAVQRDDVPAMRKALTVTVTQTQRALDVTRRLLELAKGDGRPAEACRVREAVEDAVAANVRPFPKDGIDLKIEVAPELQVRAARLLFGQVVFNLLLNARNAVPAHGGRIGIVARNGGGSVQLDVIDNGPGIGRDFVRDTLNPWLGSDARHDGVEWQNVGVGLNVCRYIAQSYGGRLEAQPNRPDGFAFRLHWPAA